jgi:hypothetical protein
LSASGDIEVTVEKAGGSQPSQQDLAAVTSMQASPSPPTCGFFLEVSMSEEQQSAIVPITKHEQRIRNDLRATIRYKRRTDIDHRLEDLRMERQLNEVWQ